MYFDVFENISFHKQPFAITDKDKHLKFDPPVYKQRYGIICQILKNPKWQKHIRKIVDFGCAEFGFFLHLKPLHFLQEINFVDIDEDVINENKFKLYPLTYDHLFRRTQPFVLNIYAGNVAYPDSRLEDCDVVTAIELIEHLFPDSLDGFPYNVFACIRPKLVFVTTPNQEFNVLFNWDEGTKFRHEDHKFEWTRQQFQDWAENIIKRYPEYTVSFCGIGCGPKELEMYGCCSQLALFVRKDIFLENPSAVEPLFCNCSSPSSCINLDKEESRLICDCACYKCQPKVSFGICTYYSRSAEVQDGGDYYKRIETIHYPFEIDNRSDEEKIEEYIGYKITSMGYQNGPFYNDDEKVSLIPIERLCYRNDGSYMELDTIVTLLQKFGYKIKKGRSNEEDAKESPVVIHVPEMNNDSDEDNTGGQDEANSSLEVQEEVHIVDQSVEVVEESWDDPPSTMDSNKLEQVTSDSDTYDADVDSWDDVNNTTAKVKTKRPKMRPLNVGRLTQMAPTTVQDLLKENEFLKKMNRSLEVRVQVYKETQLFMEKKVSLLNARIHKNQIRLESTLEPNACEDDKKDKAEHSTVNEGTNNPINDPAFNSGRDQNKDSKEQSKSKAANTKKARTAFSGTRKILDIPAFYTTLAGAPPYVRDFPPIDTDTIYSIIIAGPSSKSTNLTPAEEEAKSIADCLLKNCLNKIEVNTSRFRWRCAASAATASINNPNDNKLATNDMAPEENNEAAEAIENGEIAAENREHANSLELIGFDGDRILADIDLSGSFESDGDNVHNNDRHEPDSGPMEVLGTFPSPSQQNIESGTPQTMPSARRSSEETTSEVERSSREAVCTNSHVDMINSQSSETIEEALTHTFPDWLLDMFSDVPLEQSVDEDPALDSEEATNVDFYSQGDGLGVHPSVEAIDDDQTESNEDSDDDDDDDDDDAIGDDESASSNSSNDTQILFELPQAPRETAEESTDNLIIIGLATGPPNINEQQNQNTEEHENESRHQSTDNVSEVFKTPE